MSSVVKKKEEKEEEVTPEALLERLKNAMSLADQSDSLFDLFKLVGDLSELILRAINGSRAKADVKAQATQYVGQLSSKLYTLLKAYRGVLRYDIAYTDELREEIENDLKKVIEVYAYLKNGGSLEKAIGMIYDLQLSAQRRIKEFLYYLAKDIYSLSRPDPWSYW